MTPSEPVFRKRTAADYIFGRVIGEGSFSTVYLAKDVYSGKEFAIKVLEKRHIIKEKKTEYVNREKQILQRLTDSSKYFVHLYHTFQDTDRLYFVLTYAKNGELLQQINRLKQFTVDLTRYYSCELLLALEYLKSKGIAHRDLKPENVLFDGNWHILITDFGSAKIVNETDSCTENQKSRRCSFVGTAHYVSPEILNDLESTCSSDLWAYGCMIYQMLTGYMPFRGSSEYLIFQKILRLEYSFPDLFDLSAKDLIEQLLVISAEKRIGANDTTPYVSVRSHRFFCDVNWDHLGEPPAQFASFSCDNEKVIIADNLEPGFDEEKASKLHLELLSSSSSCPNSSEPAFNVANLTSEEIEKRLTIQKTGNSYHNLVEGNLILKQGLVDKRKGLFPRRRMFLLTLGPHLYYVDPMQMKLKGQIPWSDKVTTEAKNFKKFLVNTPNRTYYLEDPEGFALEWCKAIEEVKSYYYCKKPDL